MERAFPFRRWRRPSGPSALLAGAAVLLPLGLYLATLARLPSEKEREALLRAFLAGDRRQATEDILWTLLNTKAFIYNH